MNDYTCEERIENDADALSDCVRTKTSLESNVSGSSSLKSLERLEEQVMSVHHENEVKNSFEPMALAGSTTEVSMIADNSKGGNEPVRPKTPENDLSGLSTPSTSSPATPRDGILPLAGIDDYCSSASTSSTPREGSSSGSPSPISDEVGKISSKDKLRVTLGKDLSLMMQALNSLQSPEEKIAALCKKYADLLDQQKLLKKQLKISQKNQAEAAQGKDQLQMESTKIVTAKNKLESLCRELQKHNKAIKDEKTQKSQEEVALRQKMATEFQTTLDRIQNQMKTAVDGSSQLQFENERIGGKLNEIVEKYQAREVAMENLVKQHHLQEELVTAQLKKTVLEHQEEKEKDAEEKQKLLEQVVERTVLCEAKSKQEIELRTQKAHVINQSSGGDAPFGKFAVSMWADVESMSMWSDLLDVKENEDKCLRIKSKINKTDLNSELQYYSEKFEDFQSTLEKSNEIFASFRLEMDKMNKKLKQTENHRTMIQKKWEDSTKALADTVDYTQQLEVKQARLERLSRALQSERNDLAQRLLQYEGNTKKTKDESKRKKNRSEKSIKEVPTKNKEEPSTISIGNHKHRNHKLKTMVVASQKEPIVEKNLTKKDETNENEQEEVASSESSTIQNKDQEDSSIEETSLSIHDSSPSTTMQSPQEEISEVSN